MTNQDVALALTAALMTGKKATEKNASWAVELYERMLERLQQLQRIKLPSSGLVPVE
jgi:hypothetical protein